MTTTSTTETARNAIDAGVSGESAQVSFAVEATQCDDMLKMPVSVVTVFVKTTATSAVEENLHKCLEIEILKEVCLLTFNPGWATAPVRA